MFLHLYISFFSFSLDIWLSLNLLIGLPPTSITGPQPSYRVLQWFLTFSLSRLPKVIVFCFKPPDL